MSKVPYFFLKGDGIGPEIMDAVLYILDASGVPIEPREIKICTNEPDSLSHIWKELEPSAIMLKGPLCTPQGRGHQSFNVAIRKNLGLFANVRPIRAFAPFVPTNFPNIDIVVIRENEEDVYAGIEYRQTADVSHGIKLSTVLGCERIVRFAFEYARRNNRRKVVNPIARLFPEKDTAILSFFEQVTCFTKDNIMKFTDGLFSECFRSIAAEYPDLVTEHMLVDIGAARVAARPECFDVIVAPNLYGDILSDIAAEVRRPSPCLSRSPVESTLLAAPSRHAGKCRRRRAGGRIRRSSRRR